MSRISHNPSGLQVLLAGNHTALLVCMVAGAAVLVAMIGCEPESTHQKTAVEDPELTARVMHTYEQAASEAASSARKKVGPEIGFVATKAYDQVNLPKEPGSSNKWIAVDIEYQLSTEASKQLDLEHINLLDAESGKIVSVRPTRIQRLTQEGQPAHSRDPEFDGREEYRCLLVYNVPQACRSVKLDYWNESLTPQALLLEATPLELPSPSIKPMAMISREVEADRVTYYDVLIECQNWFRGDTPLSCELRSFAGSQAVGLHATSFVEVDENTRPINVVLQDRPFVVPLRRFVVEFRSPQKLIPLDVKVGDETYKLPVKEELDLPLETMASLRASKGNAGPLQAAPTTPSP